MHVKVSCLDANMTAGWQEMKNEQCVTIQTREKQIYGTFEMSMVPLETEDVRKTAGLQLKYSAIFWARQKL